MSKQDLLKIQTCVLKVNIKCHCDGCKQKVRKLMQKIDGVYSTSIDVEQGKVTVTGNVDPHTLIRKLVKSGKHAEIWGGQKGGLSHINNQSTNMKIEDFKSGRDNKSRKGGKDQKKGGGGQAQQQMMQQSKGAKDFKPPSFLKDQKSVTFKLPGEDLDDEDDFSSDGEFDYSDEYDDDYDELDDVGFGDHHRHPTAKMMPIVVGGNAKKGGGGIDVPVEVLKGSGGNKDGKNGSGGKKGGVGGNGKGGNQSKGGGGGGNGKNKGGKNNGANNGGGGHYSDIWGKKVGGKEDGTHMMNNLQHGSHGFEVRHGPGGRTVSQTEMGQMGNYPMGFMRNFPPVQDPPAAAAMSRGYYQGMAPDNAYDHQYPGALMSQRPVYGSGDVYQQMMYARPQAPAMGYGLPVPPPVTDQYTHFFSDENTSSCSIM